MTEHRFDAMGCRIVIGGGSPVEQRVLEDLFRQRDSMFSRFRPASELNRVNGSGGRIALVSQPFADTLRISLAVAAETAGLIDPTLGSAIEAAGYGRDFGLLGPDPEPPGMPSRGRWREVVLLGRFVAIPEGVRLDLNGVVKALAVDDSLAVLSGDGFVSAGGDVAVRGELTVALPDGEPVLLRRGALATSGNTKRRWLRAGRMQHHLIDARTGRPSDSPWALVTACGATCLAADTAAKAGFLLGEAGPEWLDHRGIPARFINGDGTALPNEVWRRSMEEALACT
jgi:thiamine biosynthesis lipoprotein